jgi:hypothetical protein
MIIKSIISFVVESEWISFILILEKTTHSRWFENSKDDSNQIRSDRSINKNERRAHSEIWVSKIYEIAKDRHETIRLVYVISEW